MIGCENEDCPIEWFHFECVGLHPSLPVILDFLKSLMPHDIRHQKFGIVQTNVNLKQKRNDEIELVSI